MSAISTYLQQILNAIWARDVRQAIHDAISQCYDDVNKPALQTDAMQRAVQAKIDAGEMAALTIADGSLTGAKLANGTIPTAKIADGAVTGVKVGTGTLTGDNIANKAIGTAKIDDGAVTWQKLASGAVHTGELADGAVTGAKLADGAVTAGKIASGVIPAIDTTLTQTGAAADAKAVGDTIGALRTEFEEEIAQSGGLSEDAREALLACFRHVMWTDHDNDYYGDLEEALGSVPLSGISATYTQGSTVVYPFDTLDSLKQNLVVVAHYGDGTQETVDNYSLTGDLTNSSSVITVTYKNRIATFTVNVTVDSALAYYVKRGTVLPGDSDASIINTGYAPGSTNKAITIVCDFMDDLIAPRTMGTIIYSNADGGGYYAACDRVANDSTFTKSYSMNCYGAGSRRITGLSDAPHRVRFAFTHAANTTYVYGSMYVDDTVVCDNVEMSATYKTTDNILALGGRLTGGYRGRGTFNLFAIYERVLSQSEIKALLEVA